MGLLLDVVKDKPVTHSPVWFMRQAGRYMPEYRAIRQKYGFLQMCYQPEIACEITMQPINAFNLDAAILFSDILPPLAKMGFDLEFIEGKGPIINNPIRHENDIKILRPVDAEKDLGYVAEALKLIRQALPQDKDLLGFCGAPFTMASYAIEGGSSKNFSNIKAMMYQNPVLYDKLLTAITEVTKKYLLMQVQSGADAVQIFDSWGGILSPRDYMKFAHPYTVEVINFIKKQSNKPIIHFVKGAGSYFDQVAQSEADVLGVDWTLNLDRAAQLSQNKKVLQGNLDPIILLGSQQTISQQIDEIKRQSKGIRHIFNLGHGIIPQTPVENVKFAIDYWKNSFA